MPLDTGTRLGPYEIAGPIGAGGMGEVYRATDSNLKRSVAIKVLPASVAGDADRLARFQREAEVLAALNHPNIAAIYGLEKTPDLTALVMELVDGEDLSAVIARGPVSVSDALPIARQIADALETAHEQGIIHRDLKPANVKVRADGTVKVLDFGLAKAMDPAGASSADAMNSPTLTGRATQMGIILGTAAYMAPEQARGKVVDRRADIWSFGVVLYEMLSGRRAFEGDDISITLASVLKEDLKWDALPADLPSPLQRLLRRCLEKDPKRRLQAIGEARIAIEESIAGAGRETVDAVKTAPLQSSSLVWKIAAGVLAATALALGVVAVLHFREQAPARELVRFQIPAPEGSAAVRPTLSPDGRQVAFEASRQLWVHSLESAASWPLPGTEGTSLIFVWSPDSRYLAFRADGKLQKIAVAGGRPQPIADLPGNFRGAAWSREGVIVFGGNQGLMQVPEAGGTPAVLIPPDPSRKEDEFGGPIFLSDGRQFVYAKSPSPFDPARAEVFLGSLDRAQAPRRLNATGVPLGYAASPDPRVAYLLLGRSDSLMAQAFDTRRLETTGEAMRVAADVDASETILASTSTTGVLAFEGPGVPGKFQLTWFDRTGRTLGIESGAEDLQAPNLSRDGKRVAIEQRDAAGASDVWIIDLSRGTKTRVTDDPADDIRPVLSPDGTRVAFTRSSGIYQKSASGTGEEERLADGETTDWSPDGRFISFIRDGDLWALPVSGDRTPVRIAEGKFNDRRGRFSPDGKWVAYESNRSGRFEIYLQSFPLTADPQMISVNGGDSAYWRGDGKELFFHSLDDRIMAVDIRPGPTPGPSVPRALFHLPADVNNGRFVSAPDGQRFLVPLEVQKPKPPVMMIALNWLDALKRPGEPGEVVDRTNRNYRIAGFPATRRPSRPRPSNTVVTTAHFSAGLFRERSARRVRRTVSQGEHRQHQLDDHPRRHALPSNSADGPGAGRHAH